MNIEKCLLTKKGTQLERAKEDVGSVRCTGHSSTLTDLYHSHTLTFNMPLNDYSENSMTSQFGSGQASSVVKCSVVWFWCGVKGLFQF